MTRLPDNYFGPKQRIEMLKKEHGHAASILTVAKDILVGDNLCFLFTATIKINGVDVATGHAFTDSPEEPKAVEKAETIAIGRALVNAGYPETDDTFGEEEEPAPVKAKSAPAAAPKAKPKPAPAPIVEEEPDEEEEPAPEPVKAKAKTFTPPVTKRVQKPLLEVEEDEEEAAPEPVKAKPRVFTPPGRAAVPAKKVVVVETEEEEEAVEPEVMPVADKPKRISAAELLAKYHK